MIMVDSGVCFVPLHWEHTVPRIMVDSGESLRSPTVPRSNNGTRSKRIIVLLQILTRIHEHTLI